MGRTNQQKLIDHYIEITEDLKDRLDKKEITYDEYIKGLDSVACNIEDILFALRGDK